MQVSSRTNFVPIAVFEAGGTDRANNRPPKPLGWPRSTPSCSCLTKDSSVGSPNQPEPPAHPDVWAFCVDAYVYHTCAIPYANICTAKDTHIEQADREASGSLRNLGQMVMYSMF